MILTSTVFLADQPVWQTDGRTGDMHIAR